MNVTGSSEAVEECLGESSPDSQSHMPLRANTTTQVCWHRTTTVGMADMQAMLKVASVLQCCVYFVDLFKVFLPRGGSVILSMLCIRYAVQSRY